VQANRVALAEQAAPGRVQLRCLRRRAEDRLQDREQQGLHAHHLDALARRLRGPRRQVGERQRAEPLERLGQPERGAVGAAGGRPDVEALDRVLRKADIDRHQRGRLAAEEATARRGHEEVQEVVLPTRCVHEHEPAGARSRER
jgi:hypothetical protein